MVSYRATPAGVRRRLRPTSTPDREKSSGARNLSSRSGMAPGRDLGALERILLEAPVRVHATNRLDLGPGPVGLQLPGQLVVRQLDVQDLLHPRPQVGIEDRDHRLHPAVQV